MNGAHSITSRGTRRRRSVIENAAIPKANHTNTRSWEVGTPTVNAIAAEATTYATGTQNLSPLLRLTDRILALQLQHGDDFNRPPAADRRRARRDRRVDRGPLPLLRRGRRAYREGRRSRGATRTRRRRRGPREPAPPPRPPPPPRPTPPPPPRAPGGTGPAG